LCRVAASPRFGAEKARVRPTGVTLAAGAAGMAALAGFVAVERHGHHPMLPLDIFRSSPFTAAKLDSTWASTAHYARHGCVLVRCLSHSATSRRACPSLGDKNEAAGAAADGRLGNS
jgi:hypothetical protein